MKKKTKKESELTSEELAGATGGAKNIDHPGVKTAMDAFNKVLKDKQTLELARSQGCLGPTDTPI